MTEPVSWILLRFLSFLLNVISLMHSPSPTLSLPQSTKNSVGLYSPKTATGVAGKWKIRIGHGDGVHWSSQQYSLSLTS